MEAEDPEKLIKKAEKLMSPGFFKALFSTADERLDEAVDLYDRAAEIYKIKREYEKSKECYFQIALIKEQMHGNPIPSYENIIQINEKLKHPEENIKVINEVIDYYKQKGNFSYCAEYETKKLDIYIKSGNNEEVLKCFDKSLDYYQMDKDTRLNSIRTVKTQKADYIIEKDIKDMIPECKYIYEEIGDDYLTSLKGQIFAQDYYFKCVLCYLLYDDYLSARAYYHKFSKKDENFRKSAIGNFSLGLINALESVNQENFNNEDVIPIDDIENDFLRAIKYNGKIYNSWLKGVYARIKEKYNASLKEIDRQYVADEDFK